MNTEKDLSVSEEITEVEEVVSEENCEEELEVEVSEVKDTPIIKKILNAVLEVLLRVVFVFRDLGLGIWKGIKGIGNAFVKFGRRFKNGSVWTKLSHFVMGAGNFARKQYIKGAIFLGLQVLFIVFMVTSPTSTGTPLGGKALANFFTLGDYHGMPIDKEFNFEEDLIGLKELKFPSGSAEAEEKALKLKADLTEKIYRTNNLIAALESNDPDVVISANNPKDRPDGKVEYPTAQYKQVIVDNRFGTNDYYAYAEYDADDKIRIYHNSVISIAADTQFLYDFDTQLVYDKDTTTLGIYLQKTQIEGEDLYQYYIIVETNKNIGNYLELNLGDANVDLEITSIDYKVENINRELDFSFLMLLFGAATIAIVALFIVVYNLNIASSYKADKDIEEGQKPTTFIEDLKSLLDSRFHITLLTPAIIFLVVFTVVPTILMIMIAFTDMASDTASSGGILVNWTGMKNFVSLFSGSSSGSEIANEVGKNFTSVLTWTFEWALIATFTCYFGGIFLALLINKKDVKLKKLWRTIFILTIAIPQFITLLVLRNLLSINGPVNTMLGNIGLIDKPIDFLQASSESIGAGMGQVWLARGTVLLINLYIGIPYTMLMTSGILMNIPKDLYEAATIDGANKWQMFRKITLPYIIFVTTPYLISSFIGNITSFNTIFLTTGGGPSKGAGNIAGHTDLLVTWLYKLTMTNSKFNAGSIIGILTFLITAFITLICYRNSKAYKEEDTFQ